MMVAVAANAILAHLPKDDPVAWPIDKFQRLCINTSGQIPYDHCSHVKFATLLEWLGKSEAFVQRYEKDVPLALPISFAELGDLLSRALDVSMLKADVAKWLNLHAFGANLYQRHLYNRGSFHAIWIQSQTFEGHRDYYYKSHHFAMVIGAAQWIIHCGASMYAMTSLPDPFVEDYALFNRLPSQLNIDTRVSIERWHLWRDGYRTVARSNDDDRYSEACKKIAGKAAAIMDALDTSTS